MKLLSCSCSNYHKCEHARGVPRHGAARRPIYRQNLDHRGDDGSFQYIPFFLICLDTPFIIPPHTFCTPSSPTTQIDIPAEAWFKVLLLVAKHSSEDLYSMAGTCKLFEEMLNDPEVWQTVSVEKYQWHPEWYRFDQEKLVEFLQKCKEHSNPKIIYKEAVTQFFIFKDDEAVNNFRVAAKAEHMESSNIVGLLRLVNPTEGEKDAMKWLCHLRKMKKIDMQACRASFFNLLMRYTISGVATPPTLAKFTADRNFILTRINCEGVNCVGNREWYFTFQWDWLGGRLL
ncbi:unnamed protein product [Prunus armeniaca]|uniref:At2g35280-like TPR domain-containing protein n=1 Tax=Prunus armeniaca TaxID=36596 RepID=A0A6J5W119_PRUAR|nr:unnamed protein product [Prunus armeniaca]CAB4294193.1 unnamed protein product [Prunus armeniaca]